jgi:antitoxin VapB
MKKLKQLAKSKVAQTRIFRSGNSLAIRLPKDFQMSPGSVLIFWKDGDLVIRTKPKPQTLVEMMSELKPFPDDVSVETIEDLPPKERNFEW